MTSEDEAPVKARSKPIRKPKGKKGKKFADNVIIFETFSVSQKIAYVSCCLKNQEQMMAFIDSINEKEEDRIRQKLERVVMILYQ
jgi:hypothetical protein